MAGFAGATAAQHVLEQEQWRERLVHENKAPASFTRFSIDPQIIWQWQSETGDFPKATQETLGVAIPYGRRSFGHIQRPGKRFYVAHEFPTRPNIVPASVDITRNSVNAGSAARAGLLSAPASPYATIDAPAGLYPSTRPALPKLHQTRPPKPQMSRISMGSRWVPRWV